MGQNLSRPNFFDAGSNPPPSRAFMVQGPDGPERKIDRYPNGFVERWIDPQGNVMNEQIIPPGVPRSIELYDKMRARIRRRVEGENTWIEHKTCPLVTGSLEPEQFPDRMQRACKKGTYGKGKACPHVEHEIKRRQTEHLEKTKKRHAAANAERLRKEQNEREGLEQQRRLNDNIERLVGHVAGGGKKSRRGSAVAPAAPEPAPELELEPTPMVEDFDIENEFEPAPAAKAKTKAAKAPKKKTRRS